MTATVVLPTGRGGWWHAYVCPVHGTELGHDTLLSGTFPIGGAACPYGCLVDTGAVRGGWAALAHQACARRIRLLSYTDPPQAVALLGAYTQQYLTLAAEYNTAAAPWMLRGRLFQQALSDAIWAVNIGHAAWTLAAQPGIEVAVPLLRTVADAAREARAELVTAGRFDSNYTAWLNAAGAVATGALAALDAAEPRDEWITGEHGIQAHVNAATRPDGWEWEASTYYHGFVLRAYLLALRGTDPNAVPDQVGDRISAMVRVLAGIATDGGILPALHDGPYVRALTAVEWTELCVLADQYMTDAGLDAVRAWYRREAGAAYDGLDDRLGGWFTGPPRPASGDVPRRAGPQVRSFADAGYTVLRGGGIHALLDHGPHGGSHGHHDKLALYLYGAAVAWQPDPGQVPYGHRSWRRRYAGADAHPALLVDHAEPAKCAGRVITDTPTSVTAEVTDAYPGVRTVRRVEVTERYLLDILTVAAQDEHELRLALRPGVPVDVRQLPDGPVTHWSATPALHGWHRCHTPAELVASPGPGTADDPHRALTRLDHVTWAAHTTYISVYQAGDPTVAAVELVDDRVRISFVDGTTAEHTQ